MKTGIKNLFTIELPENTERVEIEFDKFRNEVYFCVRTTDDKSIVLTPNPEQLIDPNFARECKYSVIKAFTNKYKKTP